MNSTSCVMLIQIWKVCQRPMNISLGESAMSPLRLAKNRLNTCLQWRHGDHVYELKQINCEDILMPSTYPREFLTFLNWFLTKSIFYLKTYLIHSFIHSLKQLHNSNFAWNCCKLTLIIQNYVNSHKTLSFSFTTPYMSSLQHSSWPHYNVHVYVVIFTLLINEFFCY